jgi:hypothetical protein
VEADGAPATFVCIADTAPGQHGHFARTALKPTPWLIASRSAAVIEQ